MCAKKKGEVSLWGGGKEGGEQTNTEEAKFTSCFDKSEKLDLKKANE